MGFMRRALLALLLIASCSPEPPQILAIDTLVDTRDTTGPYLVTIVTRGIDMNDRVEIVYTTGQGGALNSTGAHEGPRDDIWIGAIPGQPAGTQVSYYATVLRDSTAV